MCVESPLKYFPFYSMIPSLFFLLSWCALSLAAAGRRHVPPPPRVRSEPARPRPGVVSSAGLSYSSPSSLWPMARNVTLPPNDLPCTWSSPIPNAFVAGCVNGGYPCTSYVTLGEAQASCAADYDCGGITSQPGGGGPWETRHGTKASPSTSGETSYLIDNACHGDGGLCYALSADFAVVAGPGSATNDVLVGALERYTTMINGAYAATTVLPPGQRVLRNLRCGGGLRRLLGEEGGRPLHHFRSFPLL